MKAQVWESEIHNRNKDRAAAIYSNTKHLKFKKVRAGWGGGGNSQAGGHVQDMGSPTSVTVESS